MRCSTSGRLTPAAATRTSTWPAPGAGTGRLGASTSGPPGAVRDHRSGSIVRSRLPSPVVRSIDSSTRDWQRCAAMDEDDLPARGAMPPALAWRAGLDPYLAGRADERIAVLEREIARVEAHPRKSAPRIEAPPTRCSARSADRRRRAGQVQPFASSPGPSILCSPADRHSPRSDMPSFAQTLEKTLHDALAKRPNGGTNTRRSSICCSRWSTTSMPPGDERLRRRSRRAEGDGQAVPRQRAVALVADRRPIRPRPPGSSGSSSARSSTSSRRARTTSPAPTCWSPCSPSAKAMRSISCSSRT